MTKIVMPSTSRRSTRSMDKNQTPRVESDHDSEDNNTGGGGGSAQVSENFNSIPVQAKVPSSDVKEDLASESEEEMEVENDQEQGNEHESPMAATQQLDNRLQTELDEDDEDQEEPEENGDEESDPSRVLGLEMDDQEDNETKHNAAVENNIDEVINGPITKELHVQQLDAALRELEGDEMYLTRLIEMKEREWDCFLKLKKLKEIKIAKLKRKKQLGNVVGFCSVGESIRNNKYFGSTRLLEMKKNVGLFEKEVQELVEEMFAEQVSPQDPDDPSTGLIPSETSSYLASEALKNLAKHQNRVLPAPVSHSSATSASGRVIGEGRRGPKVDVTSLIADYRLKSQEEKERRPSTSALNNPVLEPLDQNPEFSYTDLLSQTKALYERANKLNNSNLTTTTTTSLTKATLPSKGKGSSVSSIASNSLSASKVPVGTTLAKLLSSNNNGNSTSRAVDETVSYNHKPASNNSAGSEKNLSLANLLASSKSRDEQQQLPQVSTKKKTDTPTPAVVCQGCHTNKAQFVCAGCANQWYCSRECQVAAWDDHSDVCTG